MNTKTFEIGDYDKMKKGLEDEGVKLEELKERLYPLTSEEYEELKPMNRAERRRWLKSKEKNREW